MTQYATYRSDYLQTAKRVGYPLSWTYDVVYTFRLSANHTTLRFSENHARLRREVVRFRDTATRAKSWQLYALRFSVNQSTLRLSANQNRRQELNLPRADLCGKKSEGSLSPRWVAGLFASLCRFFRCFFRPFFGFCFHISVNFFRCYHQFTGGIFRSFSIRAYPYFVFFVPGCPLCF